MQGVQHKRPTPPSFGMRTNSQKRLATARSPRRVDGQRPPDPVDKVDKGKRKDGQLDHPVRPAAKLLPPGVGSPQVMRRREPEPPPPVLGAPSSSPAVLKVPPPTPASVTRPLPTVSPSRLTVPPPTPVTGAPMSRTAPRPAQAAQLPPRVAQPALAPAPHASLHRSPPPPDSSVDDVDDEDDSEWYDSDAESDDSAADVDHVAEAAAAAEAERLASLQRATEEAMRQRAMFSKRRPPSRVELTKLGREQGGLSRLFHPDPEVLATVELYRTKSAGDTHNPSLMAERLKATKSAIDVRPPAHALMPQRSSPAKTHAPAPLKLSKSSAALPTVQNESVRAGESATRNTRGWILTGTPDDEESDTDAEEPDLGMSKSVAQQRLEAFASRSRSHGSSKRLTPPTPLRSSTDPVQPKQPSRLSPPKTNGAPRGHHITLASHPAPPQPIDFSLPHPYNLQMAVQHTPRTHARIMMSEELSESVRRQLLWMRAKGPEHLGLIHTIPRTQSQEDVVRAGVPRQVRLATDEIRGSAPPAGQRPAPQQPIDPVRRVAGGLRPLTPLERSDQHKANALQRTRSLAEGLAHHDYHIAGW